MAYHRIKLRRDEQTTAVTCPYAVSGICYRRGCIFIPHQHCLNKREFDKRMAKAKNMSSKKHYPIKKIINSSTYGIMISERGFGMKHGN